MLNLRPAVLALLLGTVLFGCSDDTSSTAPGEPSSAAGSEPANTSEAIPDGSYAKTATLAEAKAMGITDQSFRSELGKDGKTTYVLKFRGDRWTHFVVEEVPEPGDLGTLAYDAKGNVVMTSASDGCPGCVNTYDWSLVGDELTLKLVGHQSADTPEEEAIDRFVTEGAFTRQS